MIVLKIIESDYAEGNDVRVELSVGLTEGNAFSFAVEQVGVLKMKPEAWFVIKKAIQAGARRPLIVLCEGTT